MPQHHGSPSTPRRKPAHTSTDEQLNIELRDNVLALRDAEIRLTRLRADSVTAEDSARKDLAIARGVLEISGMHLSYDEGLTDWSLPTIAYRSGPLIKEILKDQQLEFNFTLHPPARPEYLIGCSELRFLTGYLTRDTE